MLETCLRSMPREQSPHLVWPTCAAHFQAILNEHASAKDTVRLHSRKHAGTQRVFPIDISEKPLPCQVHAWLLELERRNRQASAVERSRSAFFNDILISSEAQYPWRQVTQSTSLKRESEAESAALVPIPRTPRRHHCPSCRPGPRAWCQRLPTRKASTVKSKVAAEIGAMKMQLRVACATKDRTGKRHQQCSSNTVP